MQLRLICFEAASYTIKNSNKGLLDASNFIDCFTESANKFSDTNRYSTERDAVQQINNSTKVSVAQTGSNCTANAAKCIYNATGNSFYSVPDSLKNLYKLTIRKCFSHKFKSNNYATLHISCRFSNLSHSSLYTLKKIMEQFKARNLEVLSNSSNEVFNSCSRCFNKVNDTTENFVEYISCLNRFVELNQPFTKRTGNTENSTTEFANATQKRADSFYHSHKCLADNINNSKQTLECILEIVGCSFTQS